VKSSAMTPRQPEVPKWMAWVVTRGYCILAREAEAYSNRGRERRKSKGALVEAD